ncbi:hypothetical protein NPIL_33071 [Nephila pilipes]|uniref:Uncharacterized protein n=1 Tax=Nephila pilipes TaxID=299642 RepID=A0A8X6NC10_NEPPI|nr:hypothetical protein NPIL_33071 [Nephila pilipes]
MDSDVEFQSQDTKENLSKLKTKIDLGKLLQISHHWFYEAIDILKPHAKVLTKILRLLKNIPKFKGETTQAERTGAFIEGLLDEENEIRIKR